MPQIIFEAADLAPGDAKSAEFATAGVDVTRVPALGDPLFELAYAPLWEHFGPKDEVESREVLGSRLAWDPGKSQAGYALLYDLLLVRCAGVFAAVRDHTAIADSEGAMVHLSHALVDPAWRRTGLAGWLRAFPIQTAREALRQGGFPATAPISLIAEMEYPDGVDEARNIRLKAYERAGYRKVDPAVIQYQQPDFRAPAIIDASGGPVPLDFQLIVRRVGRESETDISGAEVRSIVRRFYTMYALGMRATDMAPLWARLDTYPPPEARIALVAPTAGGA